MSIPTKGIIEKHKVYSQALIRHMRVDFYLPPDYDPAATYPTIYLLHSWAETENYWVESLGLRRRADKLIDSGAIPPFIGVMPQGDKSFFINAADPGGDFEMITRFDPVYYQDALSGFGDYGDYILDDVIPFARQKYSVRADRAGRVIAGIEMGATGAALLSFGSPEAFCRVGIHSPLLYGMDRPGPPWIFGLGDEVAFRARDPIQLARACKSLGAPGIYLDCGLDDSLSGPCADLHYALVDADVSHSYVSQPGQNNADYWKAHLAEYLGFYTAGW